MSSQRNSLPAPMLLPAGCSRIEFSCWIVTKRKFCGVQQQDANINYTQVSTVSWRDTDQSSSVGSWSAGCLHWRRSDDVNTRWVNGLSVLCCSQAAALDSPFNCDIHALDNVTSAPTLSTFCHWLKTYYTGPIDLITSSTVLLKWFILLRPL